jgi:hypothetical protein
MPIILNNSNIEIQYNTGSSYIIETIKSDLYVRDTRTGISSNLFAEPTVSPSRTPVTTGNYKTLTYTHNPTTTITYNFTPYNDLISWKNYATSIGATTTNLDYFTFGGVFGSSEVVGSITLPLPSGYNHVKVNYNCPWSDPIYLYIDNVLKETCPANSSREYTQLYTPGQVLKIQENHSVIGENLIITLSLMETITNILNFPVRTVVDVNNNSNLILQGSYNVSLGYTTSSVLPTITNTSNRLIPLPNASTSNISVRYHLLNPVKTTEGAQWTYSSSNANVYHLGSVGIGTTSPEYSLDVRGFIYSSSGGYTSSALTKWSVLSDRRIKENIVKASYDKCLENVKNIELYNFNFKDNYVNTNDRHQLGFIAQEVQQVYPKAVEFSRMIMNLEEKIDDLLTLNTTQIDYTLYGAVKCLIQKLENIKIKMEQIKTVYNITT